MLLTVKSLVVDRGDRRIIDDLSFSLRAGETLTLLGPNGVGKTTLIRALAGFLAHQSGEILLEGPGLDEEKPVGESCHYVGHANGMKSSLTVIENLSFWSHYFGSERRLGKETNTCDDENTQPFEQSLRVALEQFDLFELADIPAGYLSAGQKRRLGLARLLVSKRPLWLLDEPTVSLDQASVMLLGEAVKAHVAGGGLVVAATHIPLGLENTRELLLASRSVVA